MSHKGPTRLGQRRWKTHPAAGGSESTSSRRDRSPRRAVGTGSGTAARSSSVYGCWAYALLAKALRESKRCALGRWAARGKQYIVMIRPVEQGEMTGLAMQQLLYGGEVRSIKDIDIPKTEVRDAELKLAQQLIEQQASDSFDPSAYTDEVRARIEAAVQKKVEGQEITLAESPQPGAQVIDLMEALRASLDKKPAKRAQPAKPAAKKAAKK
jgi:DNA end-binding protein Ku